MEKSSESSRTGRSVQRSSESSRTGRSVARSSESSRTSSVSVSHVAGSSEKESDSTADGGNEDEDASTTIYVSGLPKKISKEKLESVIKVKGVPKALDIR